MRTARFDAALMGPVVEGTTHCCLIGLVQIFLEQGQGERAAYLYGNFESKWKASTNMHPSQYAEYQQAITLVRTQRSETDFERV
jgi:hypothetical protein